MSRKSTGPRSSRRSRPPQKGNAGPKWAWAVAVVVALAVIVVAALPHKRKAGVGRAVDVELAAGESDAQVIAKLEAAGVLDAPTVFSLWARTHGGISAKPGRHLLSDDLSPVEVLRRIQRSPEAAKIRVTIPEGWHRFDIAKRLRDKRVCDDASFLAAAVDPALMNELGLGVSAEGWLFPATYEFPSNVDGAEVVRRMVAEAKGRID